MGVMSHEQSPHVRNQNCFCLFCYTPFYINRVYIPIVFAISQYGDCSRKK